MAYIIIINLNLIDIYGCNDQPTHLGMRNFIYQTNMESKGLQPGPGRRAGPRAFLNKPKWLLNKGRKRGGFEPLPSSLNFKALTN